MPEIQEITKMYPDRGYGHGRGLAEGGLTTAVAAASSLVGGVVGYGIGRNNRSGCHGGGGCGGGCDCGGGCGGTHAAASATTMASALNTMQVLAEKDAKIGKLEAQQYSDESARTEADRLLRNYLKPYGDAIAQQLAKSAALNEKLIGMEKVQALEKQLMQKEVELARQEARCCCDKANMRIDCLKDRVDAITKTVVPTVAVCPDPAAAAQDRRTDALMMLLTRALDKYLGATAATP